MDDIAIMIKDMKFRRKLLGGVDELSVYKQMEELQKEYREIYTSQQIYYQALIDERDKEIERLRGNHEK